MPYEDWLLWDDSPPDSQPSAGRTQSRSSIDVSTTQPSRAGNPPLDDLQCRSQPGTDEAEPLRLLTFPEWDEETDYTVGPPTCIRYTIEWKVAKNKRAISRDTEQDVVLQPAAYWDIILNPKVQSVLTREIPQDKPVQAHVTEVVVSVNDRSERDLKRTFEKTNVVWSEIEDQLLAWGELCRAGKKLRVNLAFNFRDVPQAESTQVRAGNRRGRRSATQAMHAERAAQIAADQEDSDQPALWQRIYALMRCAGPPCDLGPHCWCDPRDKKHYPMKAHNMRHLINYVENGGTFDSQNDMPPAIQDQLYKQEHDRMERLAKPAKTSQSGQPAINITNVIPPYCSPSTGPDLATPTHNPDLPAHPSAKRRRLRITGSRDSALQDYCRWQQSQVDDSRLKEDFRKACDIATTHALDLELLHEDGDATTFTAEGVRNGTAKRFIRDIVDWAVEYGRGEMCV